MHHYFRNTGWIEIITGSMFSGKSEELIRRLKRARIAKQKVQVFKHAIDTRYSVNEVVSHAGDKIEAISVSSLSDILAVYDPSVDVVGIDEVQFFDSEIIPFIHQLADDGKRVILAGLDTDFRGEPFGPVPILMAQAEFVTKLQAICVCCGNPATRTQRLVNGKPAAYEDPTILIGAQEHYEARCRACHEVPRRQAEKEAAAGEE
ncbi:MAG: thymidine kinase [Firmicutes bacterium]|nr:thymidine kinase [Bacillota bacterium]